MDNSEKYKIKSAAPGPSQSPGACPLTAPPAMPALWAGPRPGLTAGLRTWHFGMFFMRDSCPEEARPSSSRLSGTRWLQLTLMSPWEGPRDGCRRAGPRGGHGACCGRRGRGCCWRSIHRGVLSPASQEPPAQVAGDPFGGQLVCLAFELGLDRQAGLRVQTGTQNVG